MDIEVTQMQMREIVIHAPAEVMESMADEIESRIDYAGTKLPEEFEALVSALRGNE